MTQTIIKNAESNAFSEPASKAALEITRQETNGLEKFSGSCPNDFAADWQARMEIFEEINDSPLTY
jgi:hypothetical protein